MPVGSCETNRFSLPPTLENVTHAAEKMFLKVELDVLSARALNDFKDLLRDLSAVVLKDSRRSRLFFLP